MTLLNNIEKTIAYAKKYGAVLSREQLWFRLLSDKKYSLEVIKISDIRYNNNENNKKIKLAKSLVKKHLLKFRDILMVGVTGSVAKKILYG